MGNILTSRGGFVVQCPSQVLTSFMSPAARLTAEHVVGLLAGVEEQPAVWTDTAFQPVVIRNIAHPRCGVTGRPADSMLLAEVAVRRVAFTRATWLVAVREMAF